jgi:hypothetical protein
MLNLLPLLCVAVCALWVRSSVYTDVDVLPGTCCLGEQF